MGTLFTGVCREILRSTPQQRARGLGHGLACGVTEFKLDLTAPHPLGLLSTTACLSADFISCQRARAEASFPGKPDTPGRRAASAPMF